HDAGVQTRVRCGARIRPSTNDTSRCGGTPGVLDVRLQPAMVSETWTDGSSEKLVRLGLKRISSRKANVQAPPSRTSDEMAASTKVLAALVPRFGRRQKKRTTMPPAARAVATESRRVLAAGVHRPITKALTDVTVVTPTDKRPRSDSA